MSTKKNSKETSTHTGDKSMTEKPTDPPQSSQTKELEISDLLSKIYEGYGTAGTDDLQKVANKTIKDFIKQVASKFNSFNSYNILLLYDPTILIKSDADDIYKAVTFFTEKKPILMILHSRGGDTGSAYLIGKLCREYCNGTFIISVPRAAKSAATLLCCAADEIHMGSLSELGPIDPQINNMPALGLKNSIEHIAQLVKQTPESAEMFAKYLNYSLKPIDLGYYERVAESATQYAEKLLDTHKENLTRKAADLAYELVYTYKDHGFIIDKTEANKIFGDKTVKTNTDEYNLGNTLYMTLSLIDSFADYLGYYFYMIGSFDSDPIFRKKKKK
ncbi:MAG: hypothetical protein ACE15F_19205 [bacterium]